MSDKEIRIEALEKRQAAILEMIHQKEAEIELYEEDDTSVEEEELEELKEELDLITGQISLLYGDLNV